jgi:hypothetical protein
MDSIREWFLFFGLAECYEGVDGFRLADIHVVCTLNCFFFHH